MRRAIIGNPLAADLDHVLAGTEGLWDDLRGRRVFITGGTGFLGCWLLESLLWANDKLGLGVSATVLTRNAEAFAAKAPHLASHAAITLHIGDVASFRFPDSEYSYLIHAATDVSVPPSQDSLLLTWRTIVSGTERALEFARQCGATRYLLASSGAVYGKQPPDLSHLPEDYPGAPDQCDPRSAYGEGKRAAEMLCALYASRYGLEATVARGFAFLGPYAPLDSHFAVGNFIRDALRGGPIRVQGDGTPYRSYLYAADMAVWLWTILLRGDSCRAYNVGSEGELTISDLAHRVAAAFEPRPEVILARQPAGQGPPERYVPSTTRAQRELELRETISLEQSIEKTVDWHRCRLPMCE